MAGDAAFRRRARPTLGLVALLGLCGVAAGGPARAQRTADRLPSGSLRDGAHQFQIVIASGWRPLPAPEGTLITYRASSGQAQLAITRVEVGTRRARSIEVLIQEVERGVERATRGFRRLRHRPGEARGVATLDLWYERTGGGPAVVVSRYLFFPRYTVVLSIGLTDGAGRSERRAAEAMAKSFTPFQIP